MRRFRIQGTAFEQDGKKFLLLPGATVSARSQGGSLLPIYATADQVESNSNGFQTGDSASYDFFIETDGEWVDLNISSGDSLVTRRIPIFASLSDLNQTDAIIDSISETLSRIQSRLISVEGLVGTAVPPSGDVPGAHASLAATIAPGGVDLTWSLAPDNGLTNERQVITYNDGEIRQIVLAASETEIFVPIVAAGITLTFRIATENINGFGPERTSNAVTIPDQSLANPYAALGTFVPSWVASFKEDAYFNDGVASSFDGLLKFSRASTAMQRDAQGAWEQVAAETPRTGHHVHNAFEGRWDPTTLYEQTPATNDWPWSNDLSQWILQNVTVSGETMTSTTRQSVHRAGLQLTGLSSGPVAMRCEMEYLDWRFIQIADNNHPENYANFDILSGSIGSQGSNTTAWVEPLGGGKFEFFVVFDDAVPTSGDIRFYFTPEINADFEALTDASVIKSVKIRNVDVKEGRVHSSFIPTSGAVATRQAESIAVRFDTIPVSQSLSVMMEGRVNYEDTNAATELTFFERTQVFGADEIRADLDTSGGNGGRLRVSATNSGTVDLLTFDALAPNRGVKYRLATTFAPGSIAAAINNLQEVRSFSADARPDLAGDITIGVGYNGTLDQIVLWGDDITNAGLREQSAITLDAVILPPEIPTLTVAGVDQAAEFEIIPNGNGGAAIDRAVINYFSFNPEISDSEFLTFAQFGAGVTYSLPVLEDGIRVTGEVRLGNSAGLGPPAAFDVRTFDVADPLTILSVVADPTRQGVLVTFAINGTGGVDPDRLIFEAIEQGA